MAKNKDFGSRRVEYWGILSQEEIEVLEQYQYSQTEFGEQGWTLWAWNGDGSAKVKVASREIERLLYG